MRYLLFIMILSVGVTASTKAQDAPLVVISNSKGAPPDLKFEALKAVLKGERQRWTDGTKVTIALMKTDTPIGSATSKKIFNMSGNELSRFYLGLEFAGKSQHPKLFDTVDDLETFVARTPGAIGVISAPNTNQGVKEITIEGKRIL